LAVWRCGAPAVKGRWRVLTPGGGGALSNVLRLLLSSLGEWLFGRVQLRGCLSRHKLSTQGSPRVRDKLQAAATSQ